MIHSELLAWLGLAATVFFGGASVYLVVRRRYTNRLTFLIEKEISLFDDIVRNLPELSVTYNGAPVSENLVLLKGVILNLGDRDITPEMVSKPLEVVVPEGFAWRTAKVVASSEDVKATTAINDCQRLALGLGLFRRNEYLALEAVAEVSSAVPISGAKQPQRLRLSSQLTFQHRIADTAAVEVRPFPVPATRRLRFVAFIISIYILLISLLPYFSRYVFKDGEFRYVATIGGRPVELQARPSSDGTIKLREPDGDFREEVNLAGFKQMVQGAVIVPRGEWKFFFYIVVGLCLLASPIYFVLVIDWSRARKYRRLLAERADGGS